MVITLEDYTKQVNTNIELSNEIKILKKVLCLQNITIQELRNEIIEQDKYISKLKNNLTTSHN